MIGYAAAGGVLQMAAATVNDLFPNIKGDHYQSGHDRIQSVQLYNFKCGSENVIHAGDHDEHCWLPLSACCWAVFVNVRYGSLLAKTEQ